MCEQCLLFFPVRVERCSEFVVVFADMASVVTKLSILYSKTGLDSQYSIWPLIMLPTLGWIFGFT